MREREREREEGGRGGKEERKEGERERAGEREIREREGEREMRGGGWRHQALCLQPLRERRRRGRERGGECEGGMRERGGGREGENGALPQRGELTARAVPTTVCICVSRSGFPGRWVSALPLPSVCVYYCRVTLLHVVNFLNEFALHLRGILDTRTGQYSDSNFEFLHSCPSFEFWIHRAGCRRQNVPLQIRCA